MRKRRRTNTAGTYSGDAHVSGSNVAKMPNRLEQFYGRTPMQIPLLPAAQKLWDNFLGDRRITTLLQRQPQSVSGACTHARLGIASKHKRPLARVWVYDPGCEQYQEIRLEWAGYEKRTEMFRAIAKTVDEFNQIHGCVCGVRERNACELTQNLET